MLLLAILWMVPVLSLMVKVMMLLTAVMVAMMMVVLATLMTAMAVAMSRSHCLWLFRHSARQETRPLLNGRRLLIPRRRAAPEARSVASRSAKRVACTMYAGWARRSGKLPD